MIIPINNRKNTSTFITLASNNIYLHVEDTTVHNYIVTKCLSLNPAYNLWLKQIGNLPAVNEGTYDTLLDEFLAKQIWFISKDHHDKDKYYKEFVNAYKSLHEQLAILIKS